MIPAWAKLAAVVGIAAVGFISGHHIGASGVQADYNEKLVEAWDSAYRLNQRLAQSDRKLAESQALVMQGVGVQVIKREVIYRDKIKDPAVRDCVADSGLLDLYDASLGLDKPAE